MAEVINTANGPYRMDWTNAPGGACSTDVYVGGSKVLTKTYPKGGRTLEEAATAFSPDAAREADTKRGQSVNTTPSAEEITRPAETPAPPQADK